MMKHVGLLFGAAALFLGQQIFAETPGLAKLGQKIFFDTNLSEPRGQGCFSCHDSKKAFSDSRRVSPGAVKGQVGIRNAPTLMYAALIPSTYDEEFYDEKGERSFFTEGGLFLDGRAKDQFAQVREPFYTKHEMNLPDEAALAELLRKASYAQELKQGLGEVGWKDDTQVAERAYLALIEFMREPLFRPFNARIDRFYAGELAVLSDAEKRGLTVFLGPGNCNQCHLLGTLTWPQPPLTDYGYDNLGVPSRGKKDPGLGGVSGVAEELGQFRSPTLRNIALTAPYMHNGSMATLREVIEFYNKRDVEPERWGKADYPETVNKEDLGDLKLTEQQVSDLVALMEAFTDESLLKMKGGDQLPIAPDRVPLTEERRNSFPLSQENDRE